MGEGGEKMRPSVLYLCLYSITEECIMSLAIINIHEEFVLENVWGEREHSGINLRITFLL